MNLQIAATPGGRVAATGAVPVHGARHDAHAFEASGLKNLLAGLPAAADPGYLGMDGKSPILRSDQQFRPGAPSGGDCWFPPSAAFVWPSPQSGRPLPHPLPSHLSPSATPRCPHMP